MRSPLSSPSYNLFSFCFVVRTPNADCQRGLFCIGALPLVARVMPPKRTVTVRQDSPLLLTRARCFSLETTNRRASGLAASKVGARVRIGPGLARDACDRLLYVSAHISAPEGQQAEAPQSVFAHWRSAEAWYRDDPSVTRLPLGKPVYVSIARTSPRRDVTVVSLVSLSCPPLPVC